MAWGGDVKDELLRRASASAQDAIHRFLKEDHERFAIYAGLSFELLGKACLAGFHPALIVDPRHLDSLFHMCGAGAHATTPSWQVRTIGAAEVLARCSRVEPLLKDFEKPLKLLAELRNSVLHIGTIPPLDLKDLFDGYLGGVAVLLAACGKDRKPFFGDLSEVVETQLDKKAAEVKREVAATIARARATFKARYGHLGEDQREAVFKLVEATYRPEGYEQALHPCPACGQAALVAGDITVEWTVDYDEDGNLGDAYPVVTLLARSLSCNFCDLVLTSAEQLKQASVELEIPVENVNPQDFYEEPDH